MSDEKPMPSHHGDDDNPTSKYPNETMRLLIERASCRSFYDRKIPDEVMRQILQAGTCAPTGGNLQPFSIIRIEETEAKKRVCSLCGDQAFIATAPTNLLFCIDWHRLGRWAKIELAPFTANQSFRHFWISFQDTIIAAQNIGTAADAMGLGSVYVGTVIESIRELRELCKLPQHVFPVVLLSLGYPKQRANPKLKHDIDIITHREVYREDSDQALTDEYNRKYPHLGVEITDKRLAEMERVCRNVHGEEFARRALEKIKQQGRISVVQRYFGLHYTADLMAADNDKFLQLMQECGFEWFTKYEPAPPDSNTESA